MKHTCLTLIRPSLPLALVAVSALMFHASPAAACGGTFCDGGPQFKPVDLEELELSLQHALRQRQLEVDRRELEQWLAREVAVRTRELEERSAVIEEVALDALAAARDWEGTEAALSKLAEELGAPREELALELKRRRAGA